MVGCCPTSNKAPLFRELVENCLSDTFGIALTLQRDLDREFSNHQDRRIFPIDQPLFFQNTLKCLRDD